MAREIEPLDLDAIEAEADEKPFEFTFAGATWQMASPESIDWQLMSDDGSSEDAREAIREMLGDEQWERFSEHKLSIRQLRVLMDSARRHFGIDPEKSQASNGFSRNTRKQRRRR